MKDNIEKLNYYFNTELGWSLCGFPTSALRLFKKILQILSWRTKHLEWRDKWRQKWDDKSYDCLEKLLNYNTDTGIFHIIMYYLDDLGLTQHGSGIHGCWLVTEGEEILELFKGLTEDNYELISKG